MNREIRVVDDEPVPEGKIRTIDGKIIDRDKACFVLQPSVYDKHVLHGITASYEERSDGSLRRITSKPSHGERRRLRKAQRLANKPK